MEWLYRIEDDLFGIAQRLKEIDDRYELYLNRRSGGFEVRVGGALQIAAPFDRLDARLIGFTLKTRVENAEKLIEEIEKTNRAEEESSRAKILGDALAAAGI